MSRMIGTVSRGIRCPIIRQGDDLARIVTDSVLEAARSEGFSLRDRDVIAVTESVVARAQEIMASLEVNNVNQNTIGQNILGAGHKKKNEQVDLMEYQKTEFVEEIRNLDVMAMTPIDALNKLFLLKEKALKL